MAPLAHELIAPGPTGRGPRPAGSRRRWPRSRPAGCPHPRQPRRGPPGRSAPTPSGTAPVPGVAPRQGPGGDVGRRPGLVRTRPLVAGLSAHPGPGRPGELVEPGVPAPGGDPGAEARLAAGDPAQPALGPAVGPG